MGAGQHLSFPDAPVLAPLRRAAQELGVGAWLVGGYVRDLVLGRPHPDIDVVAEEGRGLELAARFAAGTGSPPPVLFERFGTAQVRWQGALVEFASARAESYRPDSRKPDVSWAGLDEDLVRRDFTVNTLLMDLEGGVIDRMGGLADLEAGLLRTPRDPTATFSDDPLRMLRAARFAAQLGFRLDPSLIPAMRALRDRLRPPVISVERMAEELKRVLLTDKPSLAFDVLTQAGLLEVVLPELAACRGVAQGGYHTMDVYGHTLAAVDLCPPDPTVRLAALFHDVGKPSTAAADGSFKGHDAVGAEMALAGLRRLRFSTDEGRRVSALVALHMRPVQYSSEWGDGAVRRLARAAGKDLGELVELARADVRASAYPHPEKIDDLERRLRRVLDERPSRMRLPVSGRDVMAIRGLGSGPEVGRIKERLAELVMDGTLEPSRDAVIAYLEAHPEI
ncbi:MAG: CCA tRNA nucleotidyltransferase [Candidatus Dormibacterales bacterium]